MPLTPFHFGPGLLAKACSPRRFWLSSFVVANVLIDVEVLYFLYHRSPPLHRTLHTYAGGLGMGLVAAAATFLVATFGTRLLPADSSWAQHWRRVPRVEPGRHPAEGE